MTRINSTARHRISFQTLPLPSNPYSPDGRIEFPRMSEMDEGGAEGGGGGRSFLLEKITHGCPVTTDLFSFPRTWFRGYTRSCVPRDSILSPHLDRPLLLPTPPSFFGSTPRRLSSPRIFFRAWKNYLRGRHTLWNDGWKKKKNGRILVFWWMVEGWTIKRVLGEEPGADEKNLMVCLRYVGRQLSSVCQFYFANLIVVIFQRKKCTNVKFPFKMHDHMMMDKYWKWIVSWLITLFPINYSS